MINKWSVREGVKNTYYMRISRFHTVWKGWFCGEQKLFKITWEGGLQERAGFVKFFFWLSYVSEYFASFKALKQETPTLFDLIYRLGLPPHPLRTYSWKVVFLFCKYVHHSWECKHTLSHSNILISLLMENRVKSKLKKWQCKTDGVKWKQDFKWIKMNYHLIKLSFHRNSDY